MVTSWLGHKRRDATASNCGAVLHQQIKNAEAALPVFGVRMLQVAIDDPEGTRERHAEPACHHRQVILDIFFINQAQRRTRGELIENRPQFDLLVDVLEFLDAFLQALCDRQIDWLYDSPAVCFRGGFSANQEVVNLLIDEIAVALEVLLVDIKPGRDPEESLEFRHAHDMAGVLLARFCRGDHGF
jgi:hypothetical protein